MPLGVVMTLGLVLALGVGPVDPGPGVTAVELQVNSGRPNPSFELTPSEVDELRSRLERLPPGGPKPDPPGLGYRGLVVTFAPPSAGLDQVEVYRGAVQLAADDGVTTRLDTAGVESWLLGIARERGHAELIASLGL